MPGTLAGSRLACKCGRQVPVPSLSRLKLAAGEAALSPEVRIDQMLRLGLLPEETACAVCGTPAEGTIHVWATCERITVQEGWGSRGWQLAVLVLCFGWVGALASYFAGQRSREHGRHVQFRLPVRVCPGCAPGLSDPAALRKAVSAAPLYAGLLDKYPDAELALDAGLPKVNLAGRRT